MGGKQSALKKEIAALQQESRKRLARHQEELANATKEKRQLQAKIDELQATVTLAQEEAEKAKDEAREREERMKALKWELVRQLKMTGSPISPTQRASLSPSSSTRIPLNWRLNEEVTLRQSVVSPKNEAAPPKENPGANDNEISNNPPPTATTTVNLLAPRRSLLKRSDPRAESSDAKEASKPSEAAAIKPAISIQSKSPRDSKSSDNSSHDVDSTPSSKPTNKADSKDTEEDIPNFSEDE